MYFGSETYSSKDQLDQMLFNTAFPLRKPFEELCKALGDESVPELSAEPPSKRKKLNPKDEYPLVVLAFDEVHSLAKKEETQGFGSWSRFGEMCRAIRGFLRSKLFTVFLSTSGTLFGITPAPAHDVSARMLHHAEVMLPFCELGFDEFAQCLDFHETVKLSHIASDEHLTSYGRPLCVLNAHSVRLQLTFT